MMAAPPFVCGLPVKSFNVNHPKGLCLVGHRHQFIFYKIPKTASTTVQKLLSRIDDETEAAVERASKIGSGVAENHFELPEIVKQNYFKFAYVRHPVDRFISAFYEIQKRYGSQATKKKWFCEEDEGVRFEGFLKDAELTISDEHVERQSYFLTDWKGTQLPLDFVGRFESFENDWRSVEKMLGLPTAEIPMTNRTLVEKISPTRDQLARIEKLYLQDFVAFGYAPKVHSVDSHFPANTESALQFKPENKA